MRTYIRREELVHSGRVSSSQLSVFRRGLSPLRTSGKAGWRSRRPRWRSPFVLPSKPVDRSADCVRAPGLFLSDALDVFGPRQRLTMARVLPGSPPVPRLRAGLRPRREMQGSRSARQANADDTRAADYSAARPSVTSRPRQPGVKAALTTTRLSWVPSAHDTCRSWRTPGCGPARNSPCRQAGAPRSALGCDPPTGRATELLPPTPPRFPAIERAVRLGPALQ